MVTHTSTEEVTWMSHFSACPDELKELSVSSLPGLLRMHQLWQYFTKIAVPQENSEEYAELNPLKH